MGSSEWYARRLVALQTVIVVRLRNIEAFFVLARVIVW